MTEEKNIQQNGADTAEATEFNINTDENAAGTTHLNEPIEDDGEIDKLNVQLSEQKDKYIRLMAEFGAHLKSVSNWFRQPEKI